MQTLTIVNTIGTMTRSELRAVATQLNVPRGRNRSDTVKNLAKAILDGKARFTIQFTLRSNEQPDVRFAPTIFSKKLRTHKPDKVIVPAN